MSAATISLDAQRRRARTAPTAVDFLHAGGWQIATVGEGGMTSHRGVLHPDEEKWLDRERLLAMVEAELGFTLAEVRSVYRQGRLSAAQRGLRARLDARLLEVSTAGGNMSVLARILGFRFEANRSCHVISRALARARLQEAEVRCV